MNWTISALIRERVSRFWRDQYRIWRTALDWTVWLYFIVPGLLFAVGTYRDWWRELPPWLSALPDGLAAVPPLLFVLTGSLRVFAEDADILFLRQRPAWIKAMIGFGAAYSLLIHSFGLILLFGAMAVWTVQGAGLSDAQIAWWLAFTVPCKTVFAVAGNLLRAYWTGWRKFAALTAAAFVMATVYLAVMLRFLSTHDPAILWIGTAVAWIAMPAVVAFKLRAKGTFMNDVQMERKARLASTELLLSNVMERKPTVQLRKPFLFRRSGRIFRRTDAGVMLAEMRMKAFMRKWSNWQIWFSFHSVSTAAIAMSPFWLGIILAAVLPLMAAIWIQEQWREWFGDPFVAKFRWQKEDARTGASISRFWLLAPGVLWLSSVAGWIAGGWIGVPIALACGTVYWRIANALLEESMSFRKTGNE